MLLLVYAYGGFEGALFVGGETKNPKQDMPMALLSALGAVAVIYTAVQFVTVATLPDAGATGSPLYEAALRFMGPAGAMAIAIAALVSAYGYLSANLLHAPRITYALAEQGDFPRFLGAVHPKYPHTLHIHIGVRNTWFLLSPRLEHFSGTPCFLQSRGWRFMERWRSRCRCCAASDPEKASSCCLLPICLPGLGYFFL